MKRSIASLIFLALVPGCSGSSGTVRQAPPASAAADAVLHPSFEGNRATTAVQSSENPPIDCPLRKQGIDPHDLKPFADVEKYIEFLERSDRAVWQKPDAVIEELRLSGRERIADVGAGSGYFTFRFARAVLQGLVYAIDIDPEMLRHIHHKALTEGVQNIKVITSAPDDPHIPSDADLVFVCDTLHHVKEKEAWLKKLSSQMSTGDRLVVIEFKEGDMPEGPPASLKIPENRIIEMIVASDFRLKNKISGVLPYQTFLIFTKL